VGQTIYDGAGRVARATDALGYATTSAYDALGNLVETGYADGTVTRQTYDEMNHVVYAQDRVLPDARGVSTGPATHNVYDLAGRNICVERYAELSLQTNTDTRVVTSGGASVPRMSLAI
jgi:YD repeat-containing protein